MAIRRAILEIGLDDWIHVPDVLLAARQVLLGVHWMDGFPSDPESQRRWLASQESAALPLAIDAIKECLSEGLIEVGEIIDNEFVPWPGPVDEVSARADSAARGATFPILVSELFWMRNTALGDRFGEQFTGEA